MALRSHNMATLAVWVMDTLLEQEGYHLEDIVTMRANLSVLTSEQLLALKNILFEFSISGFYTPYRNLAFRACEILLFDRVVEGAAKSYVSGNVVFYAPQLAADRSFAISSPMPPIEGAPGLNYRPSNPSILATPDGYIVLLRAVNYRHTHAKDFVSDSPDGVFRSRYFALLADHNFGIRGRHEVSLRHVRRAVLPSTRFRNEGVEDARLVAHGGRVWFTASAYDQSALSRIRMVLCQLATSPDAAGDLRVTSWTALTGPNADVDEKNWLPFSDGTTLHAFYSLGPETIATRLHPADGHWDPFSRHRSPLDLSRFRGSAGPLPHTVRGVAGLLTVVHEVSLRQDGGRYYVHRFVWLAPGRDAAWTVQLASHMFYLDHLGVEYVAGMAPAHDAPQVLLTAGLEDTEARMYAVSLTTIDEMLRPLPTIG